MHEPERDPGRDPRREPGTDRRGRGWLRALLIASLTLNLLVAGIVAGGALRHARQPPRPAIAEVGFGPFTEALSREDRAALRVAAERESAGFHAMRRAGREDSARLVAALTAEPWDAAAVEVVLAAMNARAAERMEIGNRLLLTRLAAMAPDERRAFAARLEARAQRPPPEHRPEHDAGQGAEQGPRRGSEEGQPPRGGRAQDGARP